MYPILPRQRVAKRQELLAKTEELLAGVGVSHHVSPREFPKPPGSPGSAN